jgi:UDP-N-acetylglucosamine pyrophosphorylase
MNSLVFELETLRTVTKDYASNISMAQYYQIIRLEAEIYDFGRDEVREGRCSNFEKDLRYLLTCIKDPLLLSVPRLNEFAPVLSKSRDYSFNEAVNYYRSALERELLEFSKA